MLKFIEQNKQIICQNYIVKELTYRDIAIFNEDDNKWEPTDYAKENYSFVGFILMQQYIINAYQNLNNVTLAIECIDKAYPKAEKVKTL